MWTFLFTIYLTFIRPVLKWAIHKYTGKCELLRIVDSKHGAAVCYGIESSLKRSRFMALNCILLHPDTNISVAVENVIKVKSICPEVHPHFGPKLGIYLQQICGYACLTEEVESTRKIPYSPDNPNHESLLMELWTTLKPDSKLTSRISKQWTEIGFQGDDPMTDFRGMGQLGLQNLVFFIHQYTDVAKKMLVSSFHPRHGYPFAVGGINITGLAVQLLVKGNLKTHFYNVVQGKPTMGHFNEVFCYLFIEFNKFWIKEKPESVMQFNVVKEKFRTELIQCLMNENAKLVIRKSA